MARINGLKGGRPLSLTPNQEQKMVDLIKAGNYPEVAAGACGVPRTTFADWLSRGVRLADLVADGKIKPSKEQQALIRFSARVNEALDEAESILVLHLQKHAAKGHQAAAFILERSRKARWAPRQEITGADGGPVVVRTWADIALKGADEPKDG